MSVRGVWGREVLKLGGSLCPCDVRCIVFPSLSQCSRESTQSLVVPASESCLAGRLL